MPESGNRTAQQYWPQVVDKSTRVPIIVSCVGEGPLGNSATDEAITRSHKNIADLDQDKPMTARDDGQARKVTINAAACDNAALFVR